MMTNRNKTGKNFKAKTKLCTVSQTLPNTVESGLTCKTLTVAHILPTKAVNIDCLPQFSSLYDD